jgi:hypothetical protein
MANTNPTPQQVADAIRDHGVPLRLAEGWNTRGRSWNYDGGGLYGVVNHHTATPTATGSEGAPSLWWLLNAYDKPAANMLIGRGDRDVWLASGGSCWHSGDGGPWPAIGINKAANVGHFRLFGIEIDDAGLKYGTMTDSQIEYTARVNAALMDLCGWGTDRIVTHQAWTDGSYGVNPKGPSPYLGRKGDTIHKAWREYPGSKVAENYNPIFWRQEAVKYVKNNGLWDGIIPSRAAVRAGDKAETYRLQCRLYDLGFRKNKPNKTRPSYPEKAVTEFQKKQGWEPTGKFSKRTQNRMFGGVKP